MMGRAVAMGRRILLLGAGWMVLTGACALGQSAAPAAHGFEVATVRLADRNDGRRWFGTKVAPSGRVSVSAMSLKSLVWAAYIGARTGTVEGGPKWAETDNYDIEAKIDEADMGGWEKLSDRERMERVRPLLRELLEDRFKVKIHTETRVTPVYALMVAKGGVKMKEVPPPPANADPQEQEERMRSKTPTAPPGGYTMSGDGWVGNAVQISGLLGQIGYEVGATDRIMVDETGLKGYYDFTVKLSRDKDGPTLEQQIEDQMGLRVEERKAPVDTYVIDSADRPELD